jgi:hypothetical protein
MSRKGPRSIQRIEYGTQWYRKRSFGGNGPEIFKRANNCCEICGKSQEELLRGQLVIHHKDGNGRGEDSNNSVENGQVLCRKCHAFVTTLSQLSTKVRMSICMAAELAAKL